MIDGHAVGGAAEELHPAASAAPPDGKAIIMAPRFIGLRRWTGGKRRPPRYAILMRESCARLNSRAVKCH